MHLRIAELERAVGTFRTESSAPSPAKGKGGGTSGADSAEIEQRLVGLFKEKWAGAAAERQELQSNGQQTCRKVLAS